MKNNTQFSPFYKVLKQHKELGFDGMVFLAYVAEFEAQGLYCFVSRAKISQDLPISQSGARYLIKRLVKQGYLQIKYEGRKRYLSTTNRGGTIKPDRDPKGANSAPKGGTIKPDKGAELNQMRGHEKTNTKNHNKETLQIINYKEDDFEGDKKTGGDDMRTIDDGLEAWWEDLPEEKKKDLLAQVKTWGSTFEQRLAVPETKVGLAILHRYSEQSEVRHDD